MSQESPHSEGSLLPIEKIDAFSNADSVSYSEIAEAARESVKGMHEVHDMEECLRQIISDKAATPHGPAELVDILTHKIDVLGKRRLAAFILKGRSFPTVRPKDVAHQIYRLEKLQGLGYAVFGATGVVLDAAKEQFASTCERLRIPYSFIDLDDFARIFVGYGFFCPRDGTRIDGGRCKCGYVPDSASLNVLQSEALKALDGSHQLSDTRGLIVLPTGSGKTRVAVMDALAQKAKSVLYIAPSHEVLEVAQSEFGAHFPQDQIREQIPDRTAPLSGVYLCTVQLLYSRRNSLTDEQIDYVVIDEFHHAAAPTYRKVIERISAKYLLGLTATPFRGDNQDISDLCAGNFVCSFDLRQGIDTGILSPYHYFGCFDEVDYSEKSDELSTLSISQLERKIIIPERQKAIVQKWVELAENKPSIAFCCSHRHAEIVAAEFSAAGIPSATYLSTHDVNERRRLVERLRNGTIKVLCVVDVLNEGVDLPFVECLLFLRPTESSRIFYQQLGRGLRRFPSKKVCIVIDFIGNFKNAYKILEYQALREGEGAKSPDSLTASSIREILNIPIGCEVTFDDRVLDLFVQQTIEQQINRHNIAQILIARYRRLCRKLGKRASKKEVDRNELLDSSYYDLVFRSWQRFESMIRASYPNDLV